LSGDLESIGGLSLNLDVVGIVGSPSGVDGLDGSLDGRDLSGVSFNDLLISGDLRFEASDLLLNGLLLLFLDLLKSFGESFNSSFDILKLRGGSSLKRFLLIKLLSPSGCLFLILDLLRAIFLLGSLLSLDLLLINLLLVDNVGSLDTLGDVGDGFLLRALGLLLGRLNLALDLSNHNLGLGDLFLGADLLLSGGLDDFLGRRDLSSDDSQFASKRLNIRGLGGSSDLGVDLLLLGSQRGESFFT